MERNETNPTPTIDKVDWIYNNGQFPHQSKIKLLHAGGYYGKYKKN